MSTWHHIKRLHVTAGDQDGNVIIEFAFIIMVLLVLGIGVFDFGRYAMQYNRAYSAAKAGAQFGIRTESTAGQTDAIVLAARTDAQDTAGELTVGTRIFCKCPDTSSEGDCSGRCTDGRYRPTFVEVTVQDSVELMFNYPGIDPNLPIVARAKMRVR